MTEAFDCIVLGVGGFGGGTLYHLAKRGASALGIERFGVAHDRGSSHGETRIIRKAYFEHPDYVPLLHRAYDLWGELEAETGNTLMHRCGLLLAGPPDGNAISGAKLAAEKYGVDVEELSPADAQSRFPGFRFDPAHAVLFEPDAGFLQVENCVRDHAERAQAHTAQLHTEETVLEWTSTGDEVEVRTDRGRYRAKSLIVTAGAWAAQMLADLDLPLTVVRKPVFWHPVASRDYDLSSSAPAYYFETPTGDFYGFPCLDGTTVKVSEHSGGAVVDDPLRLDRNIHAADSQPVVDFIRRSMPGVQPQAVRHSVCMYTHTPDGHFVVGQHPQFPNVVFGAGFSGHGFKFTSVLGEALADLALEGKTDLPIDFLSLQRDSLRNDSSSVPDT